MPDPLEVEGLLVTKPGLSQCSLEACIHMEASQRCVQYSETSRQGYYTFTSRLGLGLKDPHY